MAKEEKKTKVIIASKADRKEAYHDQEEPFSAVIPEGIQKIGACAFFCCFNLVSVVIPKSVREIENGAFCHCESLTSIIIPEGVTKIGGEAFSCCFKLTSVTIPNSVTEIGNHAFQDCTGLQSIVLPDGIKHIGSFCGCTGLNSIEIPGSVTSIDHDAFAHCSGLTSVIISEGVTKIGSEAFRGCTGLTSITIPDGVTEIGSEAFRGCTGLTSVTIPDSVKKIRKEAFAGCNNLKEIRASEKHKMMIQALSLEEAEEQTKFGMLLEERLDRLRDLKYFTLDSESLDDENAEHGCSVEMSYSSDCNECSGWEIWLADYSGSNNRACCIRPETEEYLAFEGENKYELSGTGETMEEALAVLEKRVEILRQNKSFKVLFSWDD